MNKLSILLIGLIIISFISQSAILCLKSPEAMENAAPKQENIIEANAIEANSTATLNMEQKNAQSKASLQIPKKIVLTLEDCISMALFFNNDIVKKQSEINKVFIGETLLEKERFFTHLDIVGDYRRGRGQLEKSYYPTLNPSLTNIPSSIMSYDIEGLNTSQLSSSLDLSQLSGLSGIDSGSLNLGNLDLSGIDLSNIDLSNFNIDYNQLQQMGFRQRISNRLTSRTVMQDINGDGVIDAQDLAEAFEKLQNNEMAQTEFFDFLQSYYQEVGMTPEEINQIFNEYMNNINESLAEFQEQAEQYLQEQSEQFEEFQENIQKINQQLQDYLSDFQSTMQPERKTDISESLAIRYSRRILEFGREPSSSVAIRAKRRRAAYDYQATARDVIYNVRKTFFMILLKKKQIETRENSLKEFEKKYEKIQKRFEKAQDILKIDVLTAELDVLNEKLRINTLIKDKLRLEMELLKLIGKPIGTSIDAVGEIPEFNYTLQEVVETTADNSFVASSIRNEIEEQRRVMDEINYEYKPQLSARMGFERSKTVLGLSLNQMNYTYGLDLGVERYLNFPEESGLTFSTGNDYRKRYYMGFSMIYPLRKGTRGKGLHRQEREGLVQLNVDFKEQVEKEELEVRKAYQTYLEAIEREKIQKERVGISKQRMEITRILREHGKVMDIQLENYRDNYFYDQDMYFNEQENLITAQENLRRTMGVFY